jgi:hypothetical protein
VCGSMGMERTARELGHQLHPDPVRTTEFAPALPPPPPHTAPSSGYAPAVGGLSMEGWSFLGPRFHATRQTGRFVVQQTRSFVSKSSAEKSMGAYAWCMRPAFAVVGPVRCASSANGRAVPPGSRARSACCYIHWISVLSRFDGVTGVAGPIGGRACNSCITNGWRCKGNRASLPIEMSRLCLFPEHRVRTLGSPGQSGWLAMGEPKLLTR